MAKQEAPPKKATMDPEYIYELKESLNSRLTTLTDELTKLDTRRAEIIGETERIQIGLKALG